MRNDLFLQHGTALQYPLSGIGVQLYFLPVAGDIYDIIYSKP